MDKEEIKAIVSRRKSWTIVSPGRNRKPPDMRGRETSERAIARGCKYTICKPGETAIDEMNRFKGTGHLAPKVYD